MVLEVLGFVLLALGLGVKHSFDADHLLTVSNVLRKPRPLSSALRIGFSWAIGHMLTAGLITLALFFFRETLLSAILSHFEKIAGIMLIALGAWSIKDAFLMHRHEHGTGTLQAHEHWHVHFKKSWHGEQAHEHRHMFGIGIIHGLASNDELLLLFTASLGVTGIGTILLGIGIFSIGVIIGMSAFSLAFSLPQTKIQSQKFFSALSLAVGLASILYGAQSLSTAI